MGTSARRSGLPAANGYGDLPRNVDWMLAVAVLAEAAAELSDSDRAAVLYDLLLPYACQSVVLAGGVGYGGSASYYLGRLAATLGRAEVAAAHFAQAVEVDTAMGARPAVARALHHWGRVTGDRDLSGRAARLAAEIGMTTPTLDRPAAAPVTAALRAEGDRFMVAWADRTARLPVSKGLIYISALRAQPGREVHVLELTGRPAGDAGPVLDESAKDTYRRRLADLQSDRDEADANADDGRAALAQVEIDALVDQLSAAMGLGGRDRRAASASERARMSVRRAIKAALDRVSTELPGLGHHLSKTVVTGTYCCYQPDERLPVTWRR